MAGLFVKTVSHFGIPGGTDLEGKGDDDRGAFLEACELQLRRRRKHHAAVGNAIRYHGRAR
jgi:hypothetical protein